VVTDLSRHRAEAEVSEITSDVVSDNAGSDIEAPNPTGGRKPPKLAIRKKNVATDLAAVNNAAPITTNRGRRIVPVHQSRIKDRPEKQNEKDSSLKIKIELDLEVEVELYARVKGDITIGLM
jgi:hypothetical protein